MYFNFITIETFPSQDVFNAATSNQGLNQEREAKLTEMLDAKLTDGFLINIGNLLYQRNWTDQQTAQDWADFLVNLFVKYNIYPTISITIEPK